MKKAIQYREMQRRSIMQFEREFFYDEVRDGFYIPGIIKRFWAYELTILSEIDRICKKYNIPFFDTGINRSQKLNEIIYKIINTQ